MSDKQLILSAVESVSDETSLAGILDELSLLQSVKQGLDETERGRVTPHNEVAKRLQNWITETSGSRIAE